MTRRSLIQAALTLPVLSWLAPKSEAKEPKSDKISSNVPELDRILDGGFQRGKVTEISNCQCNNWYAPFNHSAPDNVEFFGGQYGTPYVMSSHAEHQNLTSEEVYKHCKQCLEMGKAVVFITSHNPILSAVPMFPFTNIMLADIYLVCANPKDSSLKNAVVYRRS